MFTQLKNAGTVSNSKVLEDNSWLMSDLDNVSIVGVKKILVLKVIVK
jgi:hypothetical protein